MPTLILDLAPADLDLLLRHPALKTPGLRRRPASPLSLVWHDTPEGALAQDGLCLEQRTDAAGTTWRTERLVPRPHAIAPPGAPPELIAEDPTPPGAWAGRLLPIAAFAGTSRTLLPPGGPLGLPTGGPLGLPPGGPLGVTLLQGSLRAVAATTPLCRVILEGDTACAVAQSLAGQFRLQATAHSLAAEALALAGRPAPTRPLGSPSLPATATVQDGFALVVAHLAGVILHHAPAARAGVTPEPVHQMRVALRRLRSALLLFRRATGGPALDDANVRLKALGHLLGPPRDWDVFTGGIGRQVAAAFPDDPDIAALLAAAERRRRDGYNALAQGLDSAAFRQLGLALTSLALTRPWRQHPPDDPDQAARQAELQTTDITAYAVRALSRRLAATTAPGADLSGLPTAALHDIRLHAKRLRYAAEFFAPLFTERDTKRFLRRMTALQECLGHLNDGAVAAHLVAELGGRTGAQRAAAGVVRGFSAALARGSRAEIEHAWHRFLKHKPFWR